MKDEFSSKIRILGHLSRQTAGATQLAREIGVSTQMTHRHIRDLLEQGFIARIGSAPHTTYILNLKQPYTRVAADFAFARDELLPHFEKKYKKISLTRSLGSKVNLDFMTKNSAVYSSNIEGTSIDINSFMRSPKDLDIHSRKEAAEIQDLVDAYSFAQDNPMNGENILHSHLLLSRHILTPSRRGKYRNDKIGAFGNEGLVYLAVEAMLVFHEISQLYSKITERIEQQGSEVESIFWASWFHLQLALIHPFSDGNGRTARLVEKWFLASVLGPAAWGLATEEYYFKNRPDYYEHLKLGVNYWETDQAKARDFIEMLFTFARES